MTDQRAQLASKNTAADLRGGEKPSHELMAECIMAMGDSAAYMAADPIRPPRNVSKMSAGRRWLWAKRYCGHYYLGKMRRGIVRHPKWVW